MSENPPGVPPHAQKYQNQGPGALFDEDANLAVVGLPAGATVSDGKNSARVADSNTVLNITGWNLASLTLTLPKGQAAGSFNLQVVATSVEPATGSMASIAKNVTVQLLSGAPCATPAGVNPYVTYANSNSVTQAAGPAVGSVVASPLVPVSSSYAIVVPAGASATVPQPTSAAELDASLESLLANLSKSVGAALSRELGNLPRGNEV